ncbi:hypothetical protein [Dactylosporangium sp. NPDC049140]|uniref:hypothetical protein n=1 Tax=Dactylosporangium sp. NPDC049140 TaxID=3155647 RepID=UPI00340BE23F
MMRLTWRDGVATALTAVILASYAAFAAASPAPGSGATRVAGAAVLLAGIAMCVLGAVPAAFPRPGAAVYVAATLGVVALLAALVTVAGASGAALGLQVWITLALWLFTTVHHAVAGSRGEPVEPPHAEVLLEQHRDALPPRVEIR